MELPARTVEEVLSLMKDAELIHFACHGIQDAANSFDSGLCLVDQRLLKLGHLNHFGLTSPRWARLSFCVSDGNGSQGSLR